MKYRTLPRTELNISEVSFGLWTVATDWWGKISDADKAALLENALEKGINFFDTADTYGEGFGEEILAKVLGHRRQEFMIATKFGYDFYDKSIPRIGHEPRPQKFDREFVTFACEQSLRRLQTDYIDLYQIHNPKLSHLEMDELFETLEQLQSDGKIRYFGSALGPDIGWFEEGEASMRERHVDSLQIIYSIIEQDPARDFFPISQEENVGLITRVPHASEVLTGRYIEPPTFAEGDHRASRKAEWMREAIRKAEQAKFLVQDDARTMSQAAIKFCLAKPSVVSVLPNFTNMEELDEYTNTPETPDLTEQEQTRLDELWRNDFYLEEREPQFREI